MKLPSLIALILCCFISSLRAAAESSAPDAAKAHLKSVLMRDIAALKKSYDTTVRLISGHEFLKPKYDLATKPDRSESVDVKNETLTAAMEKSKGKEFPADKLEEILTGLKFEVMKTTVGDFATEPTDSVATPDKKIHFEIKAGDALVKASPPKGDFLIIQLRKVDGAWKVVAEYLD